MNKIARDVVVLAGALTALIGLSLYSIPLALVVGGALTAAGALLWSPE